MMLARFASILCLLAGLLTASPAAAQQGLSVQSITNEPSFGEVSSAPQGDTVFRASAQDGMVTRQSGTGYRIGTGTTRSLVTIACGSSANCASRDVDVTISSTGTPTGRAGPLANFTASMGTAQSRSGVTGTNPITFRIGPIGQNSTKTFYVGADFTVRGNEKGQTTGTANSAFQVSVAFTSGGGSASGIGTATANVRRAMSIQVISGLSFGTIARPNIGTGSVAIDSGNGAVTLTGNRIRQMPGTVSRAVFEIGGEGGQSFTVSVPPTFQLSGPGGPLTVQTTTSVSGLQTLTGSFGSTSTTTVGVGGSVQIPYNLNSGSYSGSFTVTVQYQ